MKTTNVLNAEQAEIRATIKKINRSWYNGNFSDLEDCFHNDIIFNSPDFRNRINGRASCNQTYADFMEVSEVLKYEEKNPQIHIIENSAIATYEFEMQYRMNENNYHETGVDIMVFNKTENTWKAVWRGMSNLKNIN